MPSRAHIKACLLGWMPNESRLSVLSELTGTRIVNEIMKCFDYFRNLGPTKHHAWVCASLAVTFVTGANSDTDLSKLAHAWKHALRMCMLKAAIRPGAVRSFDWQYANEGRTKLMIEADFLGPTDLNRDCVNWGDMLFSVNHHLNVPNTRPSRKMYALRGCKTVRLKNKG
jgi:hypothetical protein